MESPKLPAVPRDVFAYVLREVTGASPVQVAGLLYDFSDYEIADDLAHDWPSGTERPERDVLVAAVAIVRAGFRSAQPDVLAPEELFYSLQRQAATRQFLAADDRAFFEQLATDGMPMTDKACMLVLMERAIVRRAMQDLLAAGCGVRIHDGEQFACDRTTDLSDLMGAVMATDGDRALVFLPGDRFPRSISFVYGNDGWDVIADYHGSLQRLLAGAEALAERFADLL